MELHLDLVGGIAGDMFIAALLDAFPQFESRVLQAIAAVDRQVACALVPHTDGVLAGRRFLATAASAQHATGRAPHEHTTWRAIRDRLDTAALDTEVRRHAVGIFMLLAAAEAHVHGIAADAVTFHEVGAWDSIADVVGAAALVHALQAARWTASPAPLGGGRVRTEHGLLPVPAPATARLLLGMPTIDDGIQGERVTPTGAAILRYVCEIAGPVRSMQAPVPAPVPAPRILARSGSGFGQRRLHGLSNHLRVLCFEPCAAAAERRALEVVEFEVDDQSGEDLAAGLERLRRHAGVLDVTQAAVFGKKGRMMMHVRVLARPAALSEVTEACFRETTTIGLRHQSVQGIGLGRRFQETEIDGHTLRVKIVDRPGGATAKAEADDVVLHADHARRCELRKRAELAVLAPQGQLLDV